MRHDLAVADHRSLGAPPAARALARVIRLLAAVSLLVSVVMIVAMVAQTSADAHQLGAAGPWADTGVVVAPPAPRTPGRTAPARLDPGPRLERLLSQASRLVGEDDPQPAAVLASARRGTPRRVRFRSCRSAAGPARAGRLLVATDPASAAPSCPACSGGWSSGQRM